MNYIIVGVVVSFVLAGISYIACQNLISTLSIFLITNTFFVFIVKRQMDKTQLKIHRYHQCFQFINSFIVSLNIKGSMSAAMESAYETADESTREILDSINEMNEEEKVSYLQKYFKFDLYRLFVDTISLWNEQGGDILQMSRYLVDQVRLKEQYLITCQSLHKSKTIEFVVLWAITLSILAALRFSLSQFFSYINKTIIYQVAVVITMLFTLFSIFILVQRITKLNLEGWNDEK